MNYYGRAPQRHINTYVHSIIQFLKEKDREVTFNEIHKELKIDVVSHPGLYKTLQNNVKIKIQNNKLHFIREYQIRTEEDLLEILKKTISEGGIPLTKLKDSPVDVQPFINKLNEENKIYIIKDSDKSEVVFYNDSDVKSANKSVQSLWDSIQIPNHTELVDDLINQGFKVEKKSTTVVKRPIVQKKKNKRFKRLVKITNTHVPELNLNDLDM